MNNRQSVRSLFLAAILLTPSALLAQDAEMAFKEGMSAFRNSNYEAAIERFREVIRLDPTRSEAVALLNSSQVAKDSLVQLMMAGGEFETFALSVLEASRNADRELITDPDAAAEAAAACLEGSYADRAKAIWILAQTFGPFGVAPLITELGGTDERHFAAIYALSRMGNDTLIPLLAASNSSNAEVRLAVVQVLLQLNDDRANARLADMAAGDSDARVRVMAEVVGGDAASLHFAQANAFYRNDPHMGLGEVENYGVLWSIDGSNLIPFEVPAVLVPLELAKYHYSRAYDLGHAGAAAGLGQVYAAEVASLRAAGEDDGANAQANAAFALGSLALNTALDSAVASGDLAVSLELARMLDGYAGANSAGLKAALGSKMPAVRGAAAVALANGGSNSAKVVAALGASVQLEALRTVIIVDSNEARANALADDLAAGGITSFVTNDGTDGLIALHRGLAVDAFVVADPLPEFYARRMVKEIRRDRSYADSAVLVIDNNGGTGDIVGAEVMDSVSAGDVTSSFADLDSERSSFLAAAQAAANALVAISGRDAEAASTAADALATACGREDSISIPAMNALANCGGESSAITLVSVVGDGSRSNEARTAAANAIVAFAMRGGSLPATAGATLVNAGSDGDADLAASCSRALGALGYSHVLVSLSAE